MHFTQPLMHFFKAFRNLFERFTQALFQCGVQFFVDCLPHFFQFFGIVGLEFTDFLFQHTAHFCHALRIRFSQGGQRLVKRIGKTLHGFSLFRASMLRLESNPFPHFFKLFVVCRSQTGQLFGKTAHLVALYRRDTCHLLGNPLLEL